VLQNRKLADLNISEEGVSDLKANSLQSVGAALKGAKQQSPSFEYEFDMTVIG
jgi:membrane-bound ClpP family serine protease